MPLLSLPAGAGAPMHDKPKCPFCKEAVPRGFTTKNGDKKDENILEKSLNAPANKDIKKEPKANYDIYPLPGGGDDTTGWEANQGWLVPKYKTHVTATPHHIIPGNASMAKSDLEAWTCTSPPKGGPAQIKEDIGYSIDCAQNGIFLPRIPEAYYTNSITVPHKTIPGKMVTMAQTVYYGTKLFGSLDDSDKEKISFRIMAETQLQFHQTSHGASYLSAPTISYDDEAIKYCNQLADLMKAKSALCTQKYSSKKPKYNPPYSLVGMINGKSTVLRKRITGHPRDWKSWVTRLSEKFTTEVLAGTETGNAQGKMTRLP